MSLHNAIYDLLTRDAALRALVGDRVYPQLAEQDTILPYLTWSMDGLQSTGHMAGPGQLAIATVKIQIWAQLQQDADNVANAVRDVLDTARGSFGGDMVETITWTGQSDFLEPNDQAAARGYLGIEQTYKAIYRT